MRDMYQPKVCKKRADFLVGLRTKWSRFFCNPRDGVGYAPATRERRDSAAGGFQKGKLEIDKVTRPADYTLSTSHISHTMA